MREIKFRFWDREKKVMYSDVKIDNSSLMVNGYIEALKGYYNFQQFTDLKDKNGKEIYEGDVIRDKWSSGFDTNNSVGIVVWNNEFGGWALKEGEGEFSESHLNHHPELKNKQEVIGNIYENPELLK